jgi:hypothetical protein
LFYVVSACDLLLSVVSIVYKVRQVTCLCKKSLKTSKGAIRIRKSKNRQHNGKKRKYKRTNNDLTFADSTMIKKTIIILSPWHFWICGISLHWWKTWVKYMSPVKLWRKTHYPLKYCDIGDISASPVILLLYVRLWPQYPRRIWRYQMGNQNL